MKHRTLLTLCLVSALSFPAFADEFTDTLQKAESATSMESRMDFWLKAAELTKDEKKKAELYSKGFDLAKKLKNPEYLSSFSTKLRESPAVSKEMKTQAFYESLMAEPRANWMFTGTSFREWEKLLAMPGLDPKQKKQVMLRMLDVYHAQNLWYKEVDMYKQLLAHPELNDFEKQDMLIAQANLLLEMNNMTGAMESIKTMLAMKTLAPSRRARAYLKMGDILLKGHGWYYRPSEEQYKEMRDYYMKAMTLRRGNRYTQALISLAQAAYDLKRYREVVDLASKYANLGNKQLNQQSWSKVKELQGNSHLKLEEYREAIEVFEQLYKYQYSLADTCMALGASYYGNGDYSMALGMYDEALIELGMADDARPAQCKHWINRLKWFNGGKKVLDDLHAARAKRLNAEAAAAGKGPVVKIKKFDALRPFDDGKDTKKKKPQNVADLMKNESEDILEGGLDLD